jgi:MFS family permease
MIAMAIVAPILPYYASGLGFSATWIGIALGAFSVSRAVLTPLFGWLSDRHGRKRFIVAGLFISIFISVAYIYGTNELTLTLVRMAHGAMAALIVPIATAYVGEATRKGEEGTWMARLNIAMLVGLGAGPIIGGILSDRFGTSVAFYAMAAIYLMAFLGISISMKEPKREEGRAAPKPSYRRILSSRIVWSIVAYYLVFELSMAAYMAFVPLLGARLKLDMTAIGSLLAVNVMVLTLLQAWTGKIADRYDRRRLIIFGSVVGFIPMALIPLAASYWHLLGLIVITAAGMAFCVPPLAAISVEEGRKYGMGSTTSVVAVARSIGVAIGPLSAGLLTDAVGIGAVFLFCSAMGIPAILSFAVLSRPANSEAAPGTPTNAG